jgi:hypothetical protein
MGDIGFSGATAKTWFTAQVQMVQRGHQPHQSEPTYMTDTHLVCGLTEHIYITLSLIILQFIIGVEHRTATARLLGVQPSRLLAQHIITLVIQ